jgi:5-methylthioribose kinase
MIQEQQSKKKSASLPSYALTPEAAIRYALERPAIREGPLTQTRTLQAESLAQGNVNLIYRVKDLEGQGSVVLKQALPFAWRYPAFRMPRSRIRIEYRWFLEQKAHSPEVIPRVFDFDPQRSVLALEDLGGFVVLRKALVQGSPLPSPELGTAIGSFLARSLFYTSDFYLPSEKKKRLGARFLNPVLRRIQEELVFTNPWREHPTNRWSPALASEVRTLQADESLQLKVLEYRSKYSAYGEALIHNDFHTGSLLVTPEGRLKVLDAEFAFCGPMAHDLGTFFGNLAIAYASHAVQNSSAERTSVSPEGLLEELFPRTWESFEKEFLSLWEREGRGEWQREGYRRLFMRKLLEETAGFASLEIVRRVIGLAHVEDLEAIGDLEARVCAERFALRVACKWLREGPGIGSPKDLVELLQTTRVS